jgi:predicted CopG family antitoxin
MMSGKNIAVPDEIYERVQKAATAEGTTVEELATKALERDLARRWLEQVGREGDLRRGSMTDGEVEDVVERAVQDTRTRS